MTEYLDHPDFEQLSAHLDDQADLDVSVRAHIADCAECQQLVAQWQVQLMQLRELLGEAPAAPLTAASFRVRESAIQAAMAAYNATAMASDQAALDSSKANALPHCALGSPRRAPGSRRRADSPRGSNRRGFRFLAVGVAAAIALLIPFVVGHRTARKSASIGDVALGAAPTTTPPSDGRRPASAESKEPDRSSTPADAATSAETAGARPVLPTALTPSPSVPNPSVSDQVNGGASGVATLGNSPPVTTLRQQPTTTPTAGGAISPDQTASGATPPPRGATPNRASVAAKKKATTVQEVTTAFRADETSTAVASRPQIVAKTRKLKPAADAASEKARNHPTNEAPTATVAEGSPQPKRPAKGRLATTARPVLVTTAASAPSTAATTPITAATFALTTVATLPSAATRVQVPTGLAGSDSPAPSPPATTASSGAIAGPFTATTTTIVRQVSDLGPADTAGELFTRLLHRLDDPITASPTPSVPPCLESLTQATGPLLAVATGKLGANVVVVGASVERLVALDAPSCALVASTTR